MPGCQQFFVALVHDGQDQVEGEELVPAFDAMPVAFPEMRAHHLQRPGFVGGEVGDVAGEEGEMRFVARVVEGGVQREHAAPGVAGDGLAVGVEVGDFAADAAGDAGIGDDAAELEGGKLAGEECGGRAAAARRPRGGPGGCGGG